MLIHLAKCLINNLLPGSGLLINLNYFCFLGSFIHEDLVHIQMLYTLFYKLTDLNSPAVLGSHWEIIGFQVWKTLYK